MSPAGRRIAGLALLGAVPLLAPHPALAADPAAVLVVGVPHVSLSGLVAAPTVRALIGASTRGGAGLLVTSGGDPLDQLDAVAEATGSPVRVAALAEPGQLRPTLEAFLADLDGSASALVLIVTTPPSGEPPWLGAAALADGTAGALRDALTERGDLPTIDDTLTSDSTHRAGVVTGPDVVATAIDATGVRAAGDAGGSPIRVVDAPPPVGLYARYLDQRRLAVPVGIVTGLYAFVAGLFGLILVLGGAGPPRLRTATGWAAIAVVPLAAALMLAGHLERLTYATVFAFLSAVAIVAVLGMTAVRRRAGSLAAVAALGAGLLAVFAIEAALGWSAALTPLLGGAQLDGGRFFGLPNVQIGLLMGASVYVAQRLRSWVAGLLLILVVALFAGLPWTGSNIGAAVTIAAAAGIWWGLNVDGSRLRAVTLLRVLATVTGTVAVVVAAHRYLADAPTHISRFASDAGGPVGLWDKFVDRLGVGADLIARNPLGLIPVAGILATLWLVLRPPDRLRPSLTAHATWRDALVTILLGSVIAYVVNDSGAAAIGLGFGTALGGLLYVSLTDAPAKMEAA